MKIVCLSDLHWKLPKIPQSDLVLIAGDLSFAKYQDMAAERRWLLGDFNKWLHDHNIPTIIIGGNHDFYIEHHLTEARNSIDCTILSNSSVEFNGVKIFGTPYSLEFWDWAHQAWDEVDCGRDFYKCMKDILAKSDCRNADILLSHGPAYGYGDFTGYRENVGKHFGSRALLKHIEKYQPALTLCGHFHEGFGEYRIGDSVVLNCTVSHPNYTLREKMFVVDFDESKKQVDTVHLIDT